MVHMIRNFWSISGSAKSYIDGMHGYAADEFGIAEKAWALLLYEKKMWANAYLHGKFCACFRTTFRCEGINSHLKKFLNS
ncbi:hypothetical protein Ahy_B02g060405 [Arachis hypogaea]|uniref:Protein FAR1-RELATED SEQUENCE n=1 Tax=Arachis hypogaea TaxID=3818 RepID=A0A445AIE6_ARAHY|nr:hypothetical protein Ahy_B02g060405 [Arachis hypogaea]